MANKPNFLTTVNAFRVKHEPEILMSMGIAGLTFSVVWGIKATVTAVKKCEELKAKENKDKLTFKDIFKTTWKYYVPVVATTALSIPCVILGNRVSSKRNAALAAAYTISETALQEYKDKTKEIVGDAKVKKIEESIAQDKVNKSYDKEVVICGDGDTLFLETISGRYFKSNWNDIQQICNQMNEGCLLGNSMNFSLNQWYEMLGLKSVNSFGDNIGWGIDALGEKKSLLKIHMSTCMTPDNKPCCAIMYDVMPERLY